MDGICAGGARFGSRSVGGSSSRKVFTDHGPQCDLASILTNGSKRGEPGRSKRRRGEANRRHRIGSLAQLGSTRLSLVDLVPSADAAKNETMLGRGRIKLPWGTQEQGRPRGRKGSIYDLPKSNTRACDPVVPPLQIDWIPIYYLSITFTLQVKAHMQGKFIGRPSMRLPLFLLSELIPWNFFSGAPNNWYPG